LLQAAAARTPWYGIAERFYADITARSQLVYTVGLLLLQAAAAKAGTRTLVWHNHGLLRPRGHHLAGARMSQSTFPEEQTYRGHLSVY
jgi:hypothetical protein